MMSGGGSMMGGGGSMMGGGAYMMGGGANMIGSGGNGVGGVQGVPMGVGSTMGGFQGGMMLNQPMAPTSAFEFMGRSPNNLAPAAPDGSGSQSGFNFM